MADNVEPAFEHVELTGDALRSFCKRMGQAHEHGASRVRLWVDGGIKYQVDGGMWSAPLGEYKTEGY